MSPEARATADQYLADAKTWANDREDALRRSRRVAWWVAGGACLVTLALAVLLVLLMPLKTVVPYTLLVDRQTGFVQALKPIEAEMIAPNRALTQSFLVQYVIAREGFDIATIQTDYRKVALWSADRARAEYVASTQPTNPDSPLNRLPRSSIIETRVRSVSSLGGRTALVRFETARRDRGGSTQPVNSWVALIVYRFSEAPMSVEDRYINPLGFQVTRYRRSAETLGIAPHPEPGSPSPSVPPPASIIVRPAQPSSPTQAVPVR
jgi:type IV secretion system protein VirB8